jgi:1,4-dihydroxy-2-naphthoate octaprenyltransferase
MVEASSTLSNNEKKVSGVEIFFRLTRFQFVPLVILPGLTGTALVYFIGRNVNFLYFALVIAGISLLHLGANAIDDCYDYENGVDQVSNSIFPMDFQGWKPLPRGLISLTNAKIVSFSLFAGSLAIAAYLAFQVGVWALVLGFLGFLFAFIYSAPPLKLDYRGLGLGELAIFLSFGPIPVLGAFYVQTGMLTAQALLLSLPIGVLTVTILIDHDLIFYEAYSQARKFSLATVLGRRRALYTSLCLTILAYSIVVACILIRFLPPASLVAPIASALVLLRKAKTFNISNEVPHFYASFTQNALLSNWLFVLVLALSVFLK